MMQMNISLKYGVLAQQSCLFVCLFFFHVSSYRFLYQLKDVRLVVLMTSMFRLVLGFKPLRSVCFTRRVHFTCVL